MTRYDGLSLIFTVRQTHLGFLYDTFYMNIEEANLASGIRSEVHYGWLWQVLIADSNRLPPAEWHIPFPEIFATLNDLGYANF